MLKEFYVESFFVGKSKFYNVFIDSIFITSIKEKTYKELSLFELDKLDKDIFIINLEDKDVKDAKIKGLELLARSSHFEIDLRRKLKERGYIGYIQEKAINDIKKMGYLNDFKTAENFIISNKNKSRRFIERKLQEKKIDKNLIFELLENFEENDSYLELQIQKYINNLDINTIKNYQKTLNHFMRKGFDYKKIKDILNNIKEDKYE